ncbi:MAG: hypothetical protein PHS54_06165 [Clostridia bacterium]|nr:hypothetical protein [Clostridia bacterium]
MANFLNIFKKKKEQNKQECSIFEDQEVTVNMYNHFEIEKELNERCIGTNDFFNNPSYIKINKNLLNEITEFFEQLTTKSNNSEFNNNILNLVSFLIHNGKYNLYDDIFKAHYRSGSNFGLDLSISNNYASFEIVKNYIFKDTNRKEEEITKIFFNNEETKFIVTTKESEKLINCERKPYGLRTKFNAETFFLKDNFELSRENIEQRNEFKDINGTLIKDEETSFSNYIESNVYHRIPDKKFLVTEYKKIYEFPDDKFKRDIDSVLLTYNASENKLKDAGGFCFPKQLFEYVISGKVTPDQIHTITRIRDYKEEIQAADDLIKEIQKDEQYQEQIQSQEELTK